MEALLHALTAITTSWAIPAAVGGVLWGILGGALPGISPSIAMAILLPMTYGMQPVTAMVLLASVLCRCRIRRLDPRDPDPHARHQFGRRHHGRRLRDGAPGPRRRGARASR